MRSMLLAAAAAGLTLFVAPVASAGVDLEWMVIETADVHTFDQPVRQHGAHVEYELATIPGELDEGWQLAPDPATIAFRGESALCEAQVACRAGVNFTYFQTWIDVPEEGFGALRLSLDEVDDGIRVTIFNSAHPEGISPRGATLRNERRPGAQLTGDLSGALVPGETNRLVITHVDDCCGWQVADGVHVIVGDEARAAAEAMLEDREDRRDRRRR